MTNPIVHAIVLLAAIIIPGGLLAYFAWHASKRKRRDPKNADVQLKEAQAAYRDMFPVQSLRARNRLERLNRLKSYRRRKS